MKKVKKNIKCKICDGKLISWYKNLFDDRHGYKGKFDVEKCINCGFGQTSPQLSRSKIAKLYENYYPWKKIDITSVKRAQFKMPNKTTIWRKGLYINGQYKVKPNTTVLDVGCGLGHSLLELESIGCKAYGVDPDKNALKLARKFNLNFKVGFVEDNPFPKIKFDYIIANQVLEHTNDPLIFLKTLKKRLNQNGKIVISFPNVNSITRYLLNENWLHWHIPYHLNFFNKNSINLISKKSGLKIERLKTITPNMWTNLQIRRMLQSPKMGDRDLFWDGKSTNRELYNQGILPKIIYFLEEYNFLNRIIDTAGYGESYILTLSKI